MPAVFLHGLDSSSRGSKGTFFRDHFPRVLLPDFSGNLEERMAQLRRFLALEQKLILVGSSFGGLMATCFALENPDRLTKLILLAPALNFPEFSPPPRPCHTPALLYIGRHDIVTPPALVLPLAKKTFSNLTIHLREDDHLLQQTFPTLDWPTLLAE